MTEKVGGIGVVESVSFVRLRSSLSLSLPLPPHPFSLFLSLLSMCFQDSVEERALSKHSPIVDIKLYTLSLAVAEIQSARS